MTAPVNTPPRAPSVGFFMAAAGLVSLTSVMAQILVPFAATLTPAAERGRVLGTASSPRAQRWSAERNT